MGATRRVSEERIDHEAGARADKAQSDTLRKTYREALRSARAAQQRESQAAALQEHQPKEDQRARGEDEGLGDPREYRPGQDSYRDAPT